MATSKEGSNPLRPYHVPTSIELPLVKSNANVSNSSNGIFKARISDTPKIRHGSSARDILPDLDYSDYLSDASPSLTEMVKALVDQGLWKYTSVLFAQPFEVAKIVLQAQDASVIDSEVRKPRLQRHHSHGRDRYNIPSDEDSDTDSQSYFTSSTPLQSARTPRRHFSSSRTPSPTPSRSSHSSRRYPTNPNNQSSQRNNLTSASSITAALSTLWTTEGAWGVWKGTNSTFIHGILLSTLTTFLRSLICAVLALPDPGISSSPSSSFAGSPTLIGLDVLSSPVPVAALVAAVSASGLAGVILSPIDIARTKLMLTPTTQPPRSIVPAVKALKSWTVPMAIAPVTFLHSTLPSLISASTPLFLRSNLGIDPDITPTAYSAATFVGQVFELGIRLPIETVLRRGQIAVAREQSLLGSTVGTGYAASEQNDSFQTIVEIGPYKGLFGTMYHIAFEEGERSTDTASEGLTQASSTAAVVRPQRGARRRKGQGIEGLWRGWKVGLYGLVGWRSVTWLGGGKGGEF